MSEEQPLAPPEADGHRVIAEDERIATPATSDDVQALNLRLMDRLRTRLHEEGIEPEEIRDVTLRYEPAAEDSTDLRFIAEAHLW